MSQGNQIDRAGDDGGEIEDNLEKMAINDSPKAHLKHVHKKPIEIESDISLGDFEIWEQKFSDYIVLTGLNKAPSQTKAAILQGLLLSDIYDN